MKLKYFLALIVPIVCADYAEAQQLSFTPPSPTPVSLPQIAPATPEAAGLIKNIQFPVDYTRGSVDISIPLYEITVGDVTIPITLSYNHKGVKPLEFTHYLGQGWTLNAEPAVSRKLNGKPDLDGRYQKFPYDSPTTIEMSQLADPSSYGKYYDAFPDEYYYRLSGKSGAFIFKGPASVSSTTTVVPPTTPSNNIATIPYEPIKVGYSAGTSSETDGSFTIIDDNGITYEFTAVETTQVFYADGILSYQLPTSWKCTKITDPKGAITFAYVDKTSTVTSITECAIIEDEENVYYHNAPQGFPIIQQYGNDGIYTQFTYDYVQATQHQLGPGYAPYYTYAIQQGSTVSPNGKGVVMNHNVNNKRVSSITFPQGTVTFNMSGNTLSSITVKHGTETVRTIALQHETTSDGYPFLSYVTVSGAGVDEKYTLAYYRTGNTSNGALPTAVRDAGGYRSRLINLWGYLGHNGTVNEPIAAQYPGSQVISTDQFFVDINVPVPNSNTIETVNLSLNGGAKLYHPSGNGILKSISTKSGAVTEFFYEADAFMNTNWSPWTKNIAEGVVYSGGFRIKTIKQKDHINTVPVERHFKYGLNESGLGKTRVNIDQKYFISTKTVQMVDNNGYDLSTKWRQRIINSSINGDITFSGIPVIYDYVTEYTKVGGIDYGKTIYNYYWYFGSTYNHAIQGYLLIDDKKFEWQMGHPVFKETYKSPSPGNFVKIHRVDYSYNRDNTNSNDQVRALQVYITKTKARQN
ncbi:MAG: hypothetical protein LBR68_05950, partial [Lachnoclostridium sp.]|nr:hypothetical protein [Lachnoclostridium sp.]